MSPCSCGCYDRAEVGHMCGFAGWTGLSNSETDTSVLQTMGRTLARRGPDDERLIEQPGFRLVFRRLAINDSKGGTQPFVLEGGRIVVAVNGEIYNHRELALCELPGAIMQSRSDCEVVGHLYRKLGPRFLEKLDGIYAIAIWDETDRTLLLARDRLGVKPLYYTALGDGIGFASELKALLCHPAASRELDWEAFRDPLESGFAFDRPAGRPVATGVVGVTFVPPASSVVWRAGRLDAPVVYWTPPGPGEVHPTPRSPEHCVDRYAELLETAVHRQLMSDVPVGIFLSGGLDSALIAAIAARVAPGLEAFTLVEPAISCTGDPEAAVEIARRLGLPLHLVRVDEDALRRTMPLDLETLEHFVWTMDFPLFDVELLFKHELHRHAREVAPALKVILLGQGADEFAGGYSVLASNDWGAYAASETRQLAAARLRAGGVPNHFATLLNTARVPAEGPLEAWQFLRFGDLPAYNLWHEDRMAAAHGMEVRVPFLDHRLVELLCGIPTSWRPALFFNKAIERHAALRFLPAHLAQRPKVPLYRRGAGQDNSIAALRRHFVLNAFTGYRDKYLADDPLFSARELEALRDEATRPGRAAALDLLLRCMCLGIFERICRGLGKPGFAAPPASAWAPPLTAAALPSAPPIGSELVLAEAVCLAVSCGPVPELIVLEDDVVAARLPLPPAAGRPQPVSTGGRITLTDLAAAFAVDAVAIRPLARVFIERGWARPAVVAPDLAAEVAQK